VHKLLLFFAFATVLAVPISRQQPPPATGETPQDFPVGRLIPKVVTVANPEQSYALYVPKSYSATRLSPIIYAFDPGANGDHPVELMKDSAERYGYIVAGSNNFRNGSWKIEAEAAQAMLKDTEKRLSIDGRRVYFAGFSGGARVAARLAQICKCTAGVILNGAGFQPEASASPDARFAVFAAVGTYDFNYGEMVQLDDQLERLGYAHLLRRFDGPHQWAPENVMEEALTWLRLQAMKTGREARDDSFIAEQAAKETERAHQLEQSGDLYAAWKEYRQAAESIDGLGDNAALRGRAAELENDKAVREGAKREKRDFDEQAQLSWKIYAGLAALQEYQENRQEVRRAVSGKIADLRNHTQNEKHEEHRRVLRRALAGVLGQAMETGLARLEQKDLPRALDYFELACDVDPDSVWALSNVAVVKAMTGDRKGAFEALRRARASTKNPGRFAEWLKDEPAFAKFHGTPELTAILEAPSKH
jgi:tetratricopeptide (TPR) repeat protein